MRFLITGAAGFVGSNTVDRLLAERHSVIGVDNFATGRIEFLRSALGCSRFRFEHLDLLHGSLVPLLADIDMIIHLAANADVRFGPDHPTKDLQQNTVVTSRVLEAARQAGTKRIAFASTGSVYGEATVVPTPEDAPFPIQTSLYGASKLAAEGLISAYAEAFGIQAYIFRFVSILGERYTHGHVLDFYCQLLEHPDRLDILGDGSQRKSYLYVGDCIDAMLYAFEHANSKSVNVFNLGTDEYCHVNDSIEWICDTLNLRPRKRYSGGDRGWIGDNPLIFLDCSKIRSLGWRPGLRIRESVVRTIDFLRNNHWILPENVVSGAGLQAGAHAAG